MSFDVHEHGDPRLRAGAARRRAQPAPRRRLGPYGLLAVAGIAVSLTVIVAVSLARQSWMGPPLAMPASGPPVELSSWHLSLSSVAIALWLSALAGGLGVSAGLIAVRRGARPPVWLLIVPAAVVVAALTVLPPAGSTDALDYMAFGRMVVLGHSPYVMVPWDLIHLHDAVAISIPWEWGRVTTPYGPGATVEQYLAARLGGTSAARIVFWLKLANALAFGAVAWAADRLLRADPAARLRAHLLWTVNPLLIWQLIAAAHLDVLAAAAGTIGLVVAGGWPSGRWRTGPDAIQGATVAGPPAVGRALAAGLLIGAAADVKITFVLFGLGLAWALRRSPAACLGAAAGMLAVLLPSYAWFGSPSIKAVLGRGDRTTADNFYQLFSRAPHGFLLHEVGVVGAVLAAGVALVTLSRLPGLGIAPPAIITALALSAAWLFVWPYQLPSYEAMLICLLILVPRSWLDWLILVRLTAATIALDPGNPTPLPSRLLDRISRDALTLAVPIVLMVCAAALVGLCLLDGHRSRPPDPAPAVR